MLDYNQPIDRARPESPQQKSQAGFNVLELANPIFLNAQGHSCAAKPSTCVPVDYDLHAEHYFEHGASVQFLWRNIGQITVGVNNLFDKDPPIISDDTVANYPRYGNFFANGGYDYRGRSFFVNVTRTFK